MQQEHEQHHQDTDDRDETAFLKSEELNEKRKITFADIREHISGPVISIVFHVLLVMLLAMIIVIPKQEEDDRKEPDTIMTKMPEKKLQKIEKFKEPETMEEVREDMKYDRPDVPIDPIDFKIKDVTPYYKTSPLPDIIPRIPGIKPNSDINTAPPGLPPRTPEDIKRRSPPKANDAVIRGLNWLKENQNADGSWGDSDKKNFSAYTGMALLAFLAHGEKPDSKDFGPTVRKAIKKLVEMVGPEADKVQGGYRHAIVMYALAEAYAMTKVPMLKDIVDKGISRIIKGMNSAGSFDYNYKTGGRSDLSVAGWNYQALKAAFSAGCQVEGLEDAISKAVQGIKKTHYDSNRQMFCYGANSGPKSTMTAVGVLSLQLYGEGGSKEAKAGLETLQDEDYFWFSWDHNPTAEKPPAWALYQWYYQTQAIFQGNKGKGKIWDKWDKMFSTELIKRQKKDGRWETPAFEYDPTQGGHGEAKFKGLDQPVYATTLCCLMLQVYHRYLPTFDFSIIKSHQRKEGNGENSDEGLGLTLED